MSIFFFFLRYETCNKITVYAMSPVSKLHSLQTSLETSVGFFKTPTVKWAKVQISSHRDGWIIPLKCH